jgi:hypothetical protein
MDGRRRFGAAILSILLFLLLPAGAVGAQPPGATFEAESDGLPVGTELGNWIATDDQATLVFAGGNVAPAGTTFVADWKTAPLPGSARFFGAGSQLAAQPGDSPLKFAERFRYRMGGEPWARWFTSRFRMNRQISSVDSQFGMELLGANPPTIQFEWQLRGSVTSPALLVGHFDLSAS